MYESDREGETPLGQYPVAPGNQGRAYHDHLLSVQSEYLMQKVADYE